MATFRHGDDFAFNQSAINLVREWRVSVLLQFEHFDAIGEQFTPFGGSYLPLNWSLLNHQAFTVHLPSTPSFSSSLPSLPALSNDIIYQGNWYKTSQNVTGMKWRGRSERVDVSWGCLKSYLDEARLRLHFVGASHSRYLFDTSATKVYGDKSLSDLSRHHENLE